MVNLSVPVTAPRDSRSLVVGATACQLIGGLVPQMSPFIVAGLKDGLALAERDAGIVVSAELFALAATAVFVAPVLPLVSPRRLGIFAIVLTVAAQAGSIGANTSVSLVFLRGFAGVGEGLLYALSMGTVASHCRNPERIFGWFQVVWAVGSVALFSIGGEVTLAFKHTGIFVFIAGISLVLSPLLLLLPECISEKHDQVREIQGVSLLGGLLFVAIALYVAVSAGLFAFSGPLGERVGFDTAVVGYILTASTLVGLVGAGAATALSLRLGRAVPISVCCLGYVLVTLILCLWADPIGYTGSVVFSTVLYYFSLPYLFGLAAALDRKGRWAAAAASAYLLGFAAGPIFAGAAIATAGYTGLAVAFVVFTLVGWALAMTVVRHAFRVRNSVKR